jgi:N-acetylglutamate synthase-like GNAT family acetyltransferase
MLSLDRYFRGYAELDMLVVHPAYWARGHGGNLVKWGMELARIDKVKHGLFATKMGKGLYDKLGWRDLGDIEIAPQVFSLTAMEYDPTTEGNIHCEK